MEELNPFPFLNKEDWAALSEYLPDGIDLFPFLNKEDWDFKLIQDVIAIFVFPFLNKEDWGHGTGGGSGDFKVSIPK